MQSVFIELTKYIFAFLMAFYVLSAYRGAIIHKEEKRKGIYIRTREPCGRENARNY